ncbi:MAG: DUF512 domain-containing protein [Halanaerobiaceae bacterium]
MAVIKSVEPGSEADNLGLEPGDNVISVNDKPPRDYIEFMFATADDFFMLTVEKKDGSVREYEVERDYSRKLGLSFAQNIFDDLMECDNHCIFCFVDQLPSGLRDTLYKKDDDYRFSFLQGSFITLTNLTEDDFNRIKNLRLSPLNISVHTTNPRLRKKMLGNKQAGQIKKQLNSLARAGIKFNTQVVLCPGINDGPELEQTIEDLEELYPSVISLGLVPVGITRHTDSPQLESYDRKKADQLIQQIKPYQERFKKQYEQNWLYLADEFYLLAQKKLPDYESYHDFVQLENGIGLTRLFWSKFDNLKEKLPHQTDLGYLGLVTSVLGSQALKPVVDELNRIQGLKVEMIVVKNKFLGPTVTVTGLLSGQDIIERLSRENHEGPILIPGVALNDDGYFIDDLSWEELKAKLPEKDPVLARGINDIVEVILNE